MYFPRPPCRYHRRILAAGPAETGRGNKDRFRFTKGTQRFPFLLNPHYITREAPADGPCPFVLSVFFTFRSSLFLVILLAPLQYRVAGSFLFDCCTDCPNGRRRVALFGVLLLIVKR